MPESGNDEEPYFIKWNTEAKRRIRLLAMPFTNKSRIYAIMTIADPLKPNQPPFLIISFENGEFIALSSKDWKTVLWERSVTVAGSEKGIKVGHACYDRVTNDVYVVLGSYRLAIYKVSLSELASPTKTVAKKKVELQYLVSMSDCLGRQFLGIAVDPEHRLLFACDEGGRQKDISIWHVQGDISEEPSEAPESGSIKDEKIRRPLHCAHFLVDRYKHPHLIPLFLLSKEYSNTDTILLVAISDYTGDIHSVELYATDFDIFRREQMNVLLGKSQASDNSIGKAFKHLTTVAKMDETFPSKYGCVSFPSEVLFDEYGHLFVVENGENRRIQIFSFTGSRAQPMQAAWASEKTGDNLYRIALGINPDNGLPTAISNADGEMLVTFQ